jgi:hypothetical protein
VLGDGYKVLVDGVINYSLNKIAGLLNKFRKPAFSFYLCTNKN